MSTVAIGVPRDRPAGPARALARVRGWLPRGQTLPDTAWQVRQGALIQLLWLHAVGLAAFTLAQGHPLIHALEHGGALGAFAAAGHALRHHRRAASLLVAIGLVTASALLVHVWDGVIEAHFHFFVMVVVLALYEDWLVFLVAAAYVVLHHAGFGVLHPDSVYNHPDAIAHPLKWALIHGLFVTAAGIAGVVGWRFNENARAELTHAHAGLEEAQALAGVGSWEWDVATDRVEWSPQMWRMFGLEPDSEPLSFESVLSRLHPDDRELMARVVDEAMRNGTPFAFDHRVMRPDGEMRTMHGRGEVIIGPDGRPAHMRGTAQDVTERKEAERRLTEAHTRALEASRLKSQFVANMSHELRTPLNGVIGLSTLLMDTGLSDEQREYAEGVRTSGDALLAIVDDVLDFSKIEAGKLEIDRDVFEPEEIVDGIAAMLAPQAHAGGVELIAWVDEDVPRALWGDGPRIRQVLANLASNAVKFTHEGEVLVRVAADRAGGYRFEVRDTGIGIEPESVARIFESFSQADPSTTRRYGGTGLGLAISKRLVDLMGGEIGLDSVPGEGSTFWFTLPLESCGSESRPERPGLAGARVLVAGGSAASRSVLGRQLAGWGIEAHTVADGAQAGAAVRRAADERRPYALTLVDLETSGIDLDLGDVPVLLLVSSSRCRADVRAAGVDGIITKPVHRERLGDELERLLGIESQAARTAVAAPAPRTVDGGIPVLVAEDNEVNQLVAVRLLEQRGCRADLARNGREAVRMHATGEYAAIFMDCQMPELDGYAATAEIRDREGAARRTPIVAMTANTLKGDREKCLAAGMDGYLGKPLDPAALDDLIARLVAPSAAAAGSNGHAGGGTATEAPVLDAAHLDAVCGGDEALRANLVGLFVEHSALELAEIATALDTGDCGAAAGHAHRLNGSASAIGARRLAEIAGRVDVAVKAGDVAEAIALRPALEEAVGLAVAALG